MKRSNQVVMALLLLSFALFAFYLRSQSRVLPAYARVRILVEDLRTNNPALAGTNRSNATKAIDLIHSDSFHTMVGTSAGISPANFRITKPFQYRNTDIVSLQILARDLTDATNLVDALRGTLGHVLYKPFVYPEYVAHPPQRIVDLLIEPRPSWWREIYQDIRERRASGQLGF